MRRLLLCLVLLLSLAQTAFALSVSCTTSAATKAYRNPSTSASSVKLAKNTKLTLTALSSGWAKVQNPKNRVVAYVPMKALKLNGTMTVYAAQNGTLYKKASTSKKLATLSRGAKLSCGKVSGNFLYVKVASTGKKGYIPIALATTSKPGASTSATPAQSAASKSKAEKVVTIARKYLGVPYAVRPKPPKSFDCSGFSRYCYKQIGVSLGSNAKKQGYTEKYRKIEKTNALAKGDLVFFDTVVDSHLCDHVGIYLGGGQFIHASSAGEKVIISTLSSGYYKKQFSWGRRVFA